MLRTVCDIVCVFLLIIGLVEVIRYAILKIMTVKDDSNELLVLPIYGHNEEAEFLLRSAATKLRWNDLNNEKLIVCLDCGMDEETKHICNTISLEYDFMRVYNMNEFEAMFK